MGDRLLAMLLATSILILVPTPADAVTWRVERDGSGQFTEIQAAIDAAAAGDTIALGPGRYDQTRRYAFGWGPNERILEHVCALVDIPPLVIRGAGIDRTFIGPDIRQDGWYGIVSAPGGRDGDIVVQDLTIENMDEALVLIEVDGSIGESIAPIRCRLRHCTWGISPWGDVTDCEFIDMGSPALMARWGMMVRGCSFDTGRDGLFVAGDATVTDCTFRSLERGIAAQVYDWNHVVVPITRCTFDETVSTAVSLQGWVETRLDSCVIRAALIGIKTSGAVDLSGSGNILRTTDGYALYAAQGARVSLHGSHILRDTGFRIVALANYVVEPPVTLDLTGNWWGGLGAQEIRPRILDGYATPMIKAFVEFEPMADAPLPARPTSWGGLHGLYR